MSRKILEKWKIQIARHCSGLHGTVCEVQGMLNVADVDSINVISVRFG